MANPVLVFDLDDTLYPERQFAASGFKAAASWAEASLGIRGLADEMMHLLDQGELGNLFAMALTRRLPGHRPEHLTGLQRAYREHDPVLELFVDAGWALRHYAERGKLGLITDGAYSVQARKVAALGIAGHFERIVYTDALGGRRFSKPHPESYVIIEQALGAAGDRFVYIADNPAKDFVAPNARGWMSIMVARPGHQRIHAASLPAPGGAPQRAIGSLTELPTVLAGLTP